MRNLTKDSRLNSRAYQFSKLLEDGYVQETYKELDFFTIDSDKYFTLKVFKGTGANHVEYVNYRTAERRAEIIQNWKTNYDSRLSFKEDQKIKNKGKMSNHAAAAAAIKVELSKAYPGIKFSAKSESFSMGDSVHVGWVDGPNEEEVNDIIKKYQYGSFNGMEDMYEYTNSRSDLPQSKYVSGSRSLSNDLKALLPQLEILLVDYSSSDWHNSTEQIFNRICRKTSFPANFTDAKIVKTDCRCGQMEDFYKIVFESDPESEIIEPNQVESNPGEISIVDYSEKAFAIVGDFSNIYDDLIKLGGSYNSRLKCGKGIIFSKKKLEAVTDYLSGFKKEPEETTLRDEIVKTVEFFAEHDIKMIGEVTESTKEIARIQNVHILRHPEYPVDHPLNVCDPESGQYRDCVKEYLCETYDNLHDITEAANSGKMISLCNLSQLVNQN